MTHRRAARTLVPVVLALTLVGCASDATEPTPSPTPTASQGPAPTPSAIAQPQTRAEMPVDCLSVLAPEILEGIAGSGPFELAFIDGRVGPAPSVGALDGELAPVDPVRSAGCVLVTAEGTTFELFYLEFDPAQTQARLDSLAAFGDAGEVYQPPGTDLALEAVPGIPEAQQLQIPFESPSGVSTKTWVVGVGWEVYVDVPWVAVDVAAPMPAAVGEGVVAVAAVDQRCESMLPIPTEQLDLATRHGLASSATVSSGDAVVCHAGEASGYERVLWWEDVVPADREALLADAAAGVDGMSLQGSTLDGTGAIVAFADGTRLVAFDAHVVHVELLANPELALQLARHVHTPAWLEVPAVA